MSDLDGAVKDLIQAFKEFNKNSTSPYDTQAEVKRVEGDIAWVHIPGGVDETPVRMTVNAEVGDNVQVRVFSGDAFLVGNGTAPPTNDKKANQALANIKVVSDVADAAFMTLDEMRGAAQEAGTTLTQIYQDAVDAKESAGEAQESATQAAEAASEASTAAEDAKTNANIAKQSADTAIYNLSLVEDVLGTVNWLSQHGIYIACTETEVIAGKTYYTLIGTIISNPTGSPSTNGYYEFIEDKYVVSVDTEVNPDKTYYQITATPATNPSGNPSLIPYYELGIDEAVVQYINMHLTLTDKGLSVTDGSQSSVLISNDGVTIYGSTGQIVGRYGEGAIIGDTQGYHIEISGNKLSFMNGTGVSATEIAYMTNNELYIPRAVVVDSMQIGNWIWDAISSPNHLTLKWR